MCKFIVYVYWPLEFWQNLYQISIGHITLWIVLKLPSWHPLVLIKSLHPTWRSGTRRCGYLIFNSLAPGKFKWNLSKLSNFQVNFPDWWLRFLFWNCPQKNVTGPYWWLVNTSSCNGLVPPSIKPLHEPNIDRDPCCDMSSPGHNELNELQWLD